VTNQELSTFLLRQGTVRAADVVDGQLAILTLKRGRYALHEVYVNQVPHVMAKTVLRPQDQSNLAAEASMLSLIQRHRRLDGIAPRCVAVDAEGRILVMEHLGRGASLPARSALASAYGASRTLAALHVETVGSAYGFTVELPPVFGATQFGLTARPDALARLWQLMADPHFVASGIERTAALWRQHTLIHSDVKSEHWIERASPSTGDACLIDWELVRFGDPAWDVGCVLHEHFLTNRPRTHVSTAIDSPHISAESRAFVTSYAQGAQRVLTEGFAVRTVLCTGVRLVQTALEVLSGNINSDEAGVRLILQTAESTFRHSASLAIDLFPDLT
jgi:hypothetical protein